MTLGRNAKIALKKAATWGTVVALGAGDRQACISDFIDPQRIMLPDDTLLGNATRNPAQRGDLNVQGAITYHSDYAQMGLLRALIMGVAGVPTTVEATIAFLHKFAIGPTAGLFASYGKDDGVEAFTLASFKPNVLTLTSEQGGGMRESVTPICGVLDEDGESSSGWTFATDPRGQGAFIAKHRQGVFRCNAASGGALGSSDIFYPIRVEISINRNLEGNPGMNDSIEPAPAAGSWVELRVVLEFDEYTAAHHALFYDAMKAAESGTLLKFDYLFTGPEISGTASNNTYQSNFFAPAARVVLAPREVPGPGKLPARVELELTKDNSGSAPTGFTAGYVEELIWEIQNGDTADYLA